MKKVAAGIVLYNPDLSRLRENVNCVRHQVDLLVLVDNGSTNFDVIKFEYKDDINIVIMRNEKNLGIATALNQIISFCDSREYEWVLTLDQDSVVPLDLIENYLKYTSFNRIAILTPKITDRNDLKINRFNFKEPDYEYVDKCITSASFINIKICINLGCFDEKMFIDLVDFEYCARVQKANYRILRVNNVLLIHQLGNLKIVNMFGKKIYVTNHSGTRVYYYARNSIYYFKKHKDYVSSKTVYINLLKKALKIFIFESSKIAKLRFLLIGIRDGYKMI